MDVQISEGRLISGVGRIDEDQAGGQPSLDLASEFEANAAALYRTILAYTGGRADIAEDAVAEAFARAAAHADRIRRPAAWLYRVAFNVANDELRREGHVSAAPLLEEVVLPPEVTELFEALRALPPRERAAMVLFYLLDLPVSEVARRIGVARPRSACT